MDAAAKLANAFMNDDMITINLEDGGSFTVQKAILSNASDYFDRAVNGRFLEASTKTLTLKEWTTAWFQLFLHWLCRRSLPPFFEVIEQMPIGTPEKIKALLAAVCDTQVNLVRLWINAGMCLMPELQNAAMKSLLKVLQTTHPQAPAIRLSYEQTEFDSKLRSLLLNEFAYCYLGFDQEDSARRLYSPEDMDEIGSIPGTFAALMKITKKGKGDYLKEMWRVVDDEEVDSTELFDYMVPTGEEEMDTSN